MASLGQLVIELAANTARLQSDMGKAVGIAEGAARKMKAVFAFAGAGVGGGLLGTFLIGAAKQAIKFGDDLEKAAVKAGVGGKVISELSYAAKLADVDLGSLSTAIKKMQVSLSEASTGGKEQVKTLAALGLTIDDLRKRKPDQQFELLAQRISELKDPAERVRAAVELFGKAGADLLPMFEQGAAGIRKAREEARKLGLSFNDDQLKALGGADDAIKRLSASWEGFWVTLTARVAPALSNVLDKLSGIDTRSVDQALDDQISSLEKSLERANIGYGGGVGGMNTEAQARARAELAGLKARRALGNAPELGEDGGRRGRYMGSALGFANEAAGEAAKKAAEAARKSREEYAMAEYELRADLGRDAKKHFDKEVSDFLAKEDAKVEAAREGAERLRELNEQMAKEFSVPASIFRDAFLNAFDDMVNTGKFKWDELLKFMLAEFARRGIVKLFDSIFAGSGSGSGGNGAGFWSALASAFGGGKAVGGAVQKGKFYEVGERGRELFAPGMSGSIIPNNAIGGSTVIAPVYNIDARGATKDLADALPSILKKNNEALRSDIIQGIRTRRYAIR